MSVPKTSCLGNTRDIETINSETVTENVPQTDIFRTAVHFKSGADRSEARGLGTAQCGSAFVMLNCEPWVRALLLASQLPNSPSSTH
jgi:hypothetical protein